MKENTNIILAKRIKQVRRDCGLTQEQMAKTLNISRSTLASWETGTRQPTASELVAFCRQFAVTFDYMCGRSDSSKTITAEKYEIDWSKLSPIGRFILWELYKLFTTRTPFCSAKLLDEN